MGEEIRIIILLLELAVLSFQDVREKRLWLPVIGAMLTAGVLLNAGELYYCKDIQDIRIIISGVIFGVMVAVMGHLTGMLGAGDGMVLVLIALMYHRISVMILFLFAMTMAAVTAMFLVMVRRVKRKYAMPFVPFLFFSLIGVSVCM